MTNSGEHALPIKLYVQPPYLMYLSSILNRISRYAILAGEMP